MNAAPYGVVDFKTITNTSLSIQARGIYCYLACYANKMHKAFPSRERILSELGLSKNGYYRHYHQLEDNGIMMIKRSMCKNNSYHLFFRKLTENHKYGFAYKSIMTDPKISLAAKVVFAYITAYCPKGRIWYFKKSDITRELGISTFVLGRALKELCTLELIDMTVSQYQYSIINMYDSSEKEGHETPKNEDTEIEKGGHEEPTNEDTEQYKDYQYKFYQSSPISHTEEYEEKSDGLLQVNMSGEEIEELVEKEISTNCFNKHNTYYFLIVLTQYASNRHYVKRLNNLLEEKELSLSSFAYAFLQRYEYKAKKMIIKNPIKYMQTCLYEFITHFDYLRDEVKTSNVYSGYAASYDISAFEGTIILDDF